MRASVGTRTTRTSSDTILTAPIPTPSDASPISESTGKTLHHALLIAGWAKITALAGKCQQIFVTAVFAFDASKAVVKAQAGGQITIFRIAEFALCSFRHQCGYGPTNVSSRGRHMRAVKPGNRTSAMRSAGPRVPRGSMLPGGSSAGSKGVARGRYLAESDIQIAS